MNTGTYRLKMEGSNIYFPKLLEHPKSCWRIAFESSIIHAFAGRFLHCHILKNEKSSST